MSLQGQQEVLKKVVAEAWSNPDFKKALIDAPVETIEKFTGAKVNLPAGKTLAIYDQSNPDVISINIPARPNLDSVELTDEDLEIVAGGGYPSSQVPKIPIDIGGGTGPYGGPEPYPDLDDYLLIFQPPEKTTW